MGPREKVVNSILDVSEPSWHKGIYAKLVFRQSTRLASYLHVTELIAFFDALSILFASYLTKATRYFDLRKHF